MKIFRDLSGSDRAKLLAKAGCRLIGREQFAARLFN